MQIFSFKSREGAKSTYFDDGKMQMPVECLLDVAHVFHLRYTAYTDLLAAIVIGNHHGPRVAIHLRSVKLEVIHA